MSPFLIRPLGCRENLIAFEVRGGRPLGDASRDIREEFTLWDPRGQAHKPYPEIPITRAMTGREYLQRQREAWEDHVAATRRLFGAVPLAGVPRTDLPVRGMIAFHVEVLDKGGRWTLAYHAGPRWYFTPAQLQDGVPTALPPAHELQEEGDRPER